MSEHELGDILYAREFKKCAPDWETSTLAEKRDAFLYFCETYAFIRHPSKGKIPFVLRQSQIETVDAWLGNRWTIVLKARQIGFSTLCSIYSFWLTYFYRDRQVILISKGEREASMLLDHAKYVYQFMPEWMRLMGPMGNPTLTSWKMSNNSKLLSMPSASNPARGATAFLIVVDEIAFLPDSENAWASIEPVVNMGGSCIMLSTANGEGNLFHKVWVGAKQEANRFKGIFFPWWASDRDEAWYEEQCRDLPEWQVAQEYPSNPEEAFLKSGRPVFDLEKLASIPTAEPKRKGRLDITKEGVAFAEDGGNLSVWEDPVVDGTYVIGADVAMGLEHGDWSSAHVINARTGELAATWWGKAEPDLFGGYVLHRLGEWYNNALIGVENNNHGLTTVTSLRDNQYPNMYRQRNQAKRMMTQTETLGWSTNRATKPLMIDELAKAVRDDSVKLRDPLTISEMRTFVREGDGKMHGSPHDDRVMSLAIAVQMLKFCWLPTYRAGKKKPGPGTWGYMIEKVLSMKEPEGKREGPIGSTAKTSAA